MKKWLFNPFMYVAGAKALAIGWLFMLLTAFIGHYSNIHFDGALDLHSGKVTPTWFYFAEQLVDWGFATLVFYIAGRLSSRSSIRFIDVAGTMALARWVWIFAVIIDLIFIIPSTPTNGSLQDLINDIGYMFVIGAFIELFFIIWFVALMYNAFTVSCNLKGSKAVTAFIVALVIAELLSKITLHLIAKHTF